MDKTQLAVRVFDTNAKQYQDKFMDFALYNDSFDMFCSLIAKQGAEILDIACGPGNITKYLLGKRPDFKILGIDLAPNMLELAKQNNPAAEFKLMDCRDINTLNKKFDAVVCGFCTPYLSKKEVQELVGDVHNLLNRDGVFYLSTMEDDYGKSGWQTTASGNKLYIHYHEAGYLSGFLQQAGFSITHLLRKPFTEENGSDTTDLIIIASK